MERYSTFVDDRDTVLCFLVFQDIRQPLRQTSQPVRERQVKRQLAQSKSHQLSRERSQLGASQCYSRGAYINWAKICIT